jgi:flagellar basal-body rod modification protein FlgD
MVDPNNVLWSSLDNMPQTDLTPFRPVGRTPNSELDRQAFLNLLMTQLKFQDPLNPMDDRDFMAQMAQFSALEQMTNLNQTFERSQAFAMIGKTVEFSFRHPQSGEWIDDRGTVIAVTTQGSEAFLLVNGMDVPLHGVTAVGQDSNVPEQLDFIMEMVHQNRVQDLVGMYVQALLHNFQTGEVTDFIEGRVDYIKISGNQSVLVVGNREVFPSEIATVSNGPILMGATGFTNGTEITNVVINNGRAYVVFDNSGVEIRVERINYLMEALKYIEQEITHGGISGTVRDITIRNGIPFFNVRVPEVVDGTATGNYTMQEINYVLYRRDRNNA